MKSKTARPAARSVWIMLYRAVGLLGLGLVSVVFAPQLLAFPHVARIGDMHVHSERPIPARMTAVLARSDQLLRGSEIYGPGHGRRIFLTDGGWRWRVLSIGAPSAFAFSRTFTEAIVVNRSDAATDVVIGRRRSLSSIIAHEQTHGLLRARYGVLVDWRAPRWLVEGYADHVAGESTLTDAEAAALRSRGIAHPALVYFEGRKRVAAALAEGRSVDSLFERN